ncbi:hypothetical protein BDN70DRAFT_989336 [Pholiota conissans]|uniref:Transmembrane protein n=1 Tax=Pholiota conissans TaxID=109636 RepID=A0A9P5ZDV6_9AGAR|nr:hypothetical protein BDN70DRAFT_989336 [Pholiota conissans]
MPSFPLILEDTSPMLRFSSQWISGTSSGDSSLDQYSEISFMVTFVQGETTSFTFNGTGFSIVGGKRPNHGFYSVNVNGVNSPAFNGTSANNLFNQTLFSNEQLQKGTHTAVLKNDGVTDVDFVAIEVGIGQDDEDLIVNTYQDIHPIFTYAPLSSWTTTPESVGAFSGSSGHATQDEGAEVKMTFERNQGDGITIYGPVGPSMTSSYSVQIDNGPSASFSANKAFYRSQQIIFFATNLGPGPHILSMVLNDAGQLAIDYVNVFTTASLGGSFVGILSEANTTNSTPSPAFHSSTSSKSHLPVGVLIALCITSAISLVFMVQLVWRKIPKKQSLNIDRETAMPFQIGVSHPHNVIDSSLSSTPSTTLRSRVTATSPPEYQEITNYLQPERTKGATGSQ